MGPEDYSLESVSHDPSLQRLLAQVDRHALPQRDRMLMRRGVRAAIVLLGVILVLRLVGADTTETLLAVVTVSAWMLVLAVERTMVQLQLGQFRQVVVTEWVAAARREATRADSGTGSGEA